MIVAALLLIAQAVPPPPPGYVVDKPNPFDRFDPKPEHLGPGPHTLIIANGKGMTRIDYKSGEACERAKAAIHAQTGTRQENGVIYYSTVTAFCVPR